METTQGRRPQAAANDIMRLGRMLGGGEGGPRAAAAGVLLNWTLGAFAAGDGATAVQVLGWPTIGQLLSDPRLPGDARAGRLRRAMEGGRAARYLVDPRLLRTTPQIREATALAMARRGMRIERGRDGGPVIPLDPMAPVIPGRADPSPIRILQSWRDPAATGLEGAPEEPGAEAEDPLFLLGMLTAGSVGPWEGAGQAEQAQTIIITGHGLGMPDEVMRGLEHGYRCACAAGMDAPQRRGLFSRHAGLALERLYTPRAHRTREEEGRPEPVPVPPIIPPAMMMAELERVARAEGGRILAGRRFISPIPGGWLDQDGDGRNDMAEDSPVRNFLNDSLARAAEARSRARRRRIGPVVAPARQAQDDGPEPGRRRRH